jgi:hypothetical protein
MSVHRRTIRGSARPRISLGTRPSARRQRAVGGRPRGSGDIRVDSVDTRTPARRRARPGCCINPQERENPNGKPWADRRASHPQRAGSGFVGEGQPRTSFVVSSFVVPPIRRGREATTGGDSHKHQQAGGEAHPGRQTTTPPVYVSALLLRDDAALPFVGRCRGTQCSTVGSGSASLPRPRRRRQCSTAFWNERPPGQGRQALRSSGQHVVPLHSQDRPGTDACPAPHERFAPFFFCRVGQVVPPRRPKRTASPLPTFRRWVPRKTNRLIPPSLPPLPPPPPPPLLPPPLPWLVRLSPRGGFTVGCRSRGVGSLVGSTESEPHQPSTLPFPIRENAETKPCQAFRRLRFVGADK